MAKHTNTGRPANPGRPLRPDDRLTTVLPPVIDDRSPRRRDPIEEVKAALDSPAAAPAPQRDPLDEVRAALDGR
ncbi:hypothetical protein, partial [Mycobacterium palustre]